MRRIKIIYLCLLAISCNNVSINKKNCSDSSKDNLLQDSITSTKSNQDTLKETQIAFTDSILEFSTGAFPESWDIQHTLRAKGEKVLIWIYAKNDIGREWKSCIVINQSLDSLGNLEYCIADETTDEFPFEKWHTSWIDYAPDSINTFGYNDLLIECYKHKPTKKDLDKLFNRFMFAFSSKSYLTLEAGIDIEFWKSIFGFKPTNLLARKKQLAIKAAMCNASSKKM